MWPTFPALACRTSRDRVNGTPGSEGACSTVGILSHTQGTTLAPYDHYIEYSFDSI
jgi:hypothetical protein